MGQVSYSGQLGYCYSCDRNGNNDEEKAQPTGPPCPALSLLALFLGQRVTSSGVIYPRGHHMHQSNQSTRNTAKQRCQN